MKKNTTLARLAKTYFKNRCHVTHTPFGKKGTVHQIHHVNYIPNDVERKNYPPGPKGDESYYADLEPQIKARPDDFVLVTRGVHAKLDHYKNGVTNMNKFALTRFCVLAIKSKEGKHGRRR